MREQAPRERIAIVDDDSLFREALVANLEDVGFQVGEFEGGGAFLASTPSSSFDMALLDWKMTDMSGMDVLRAIRGSNSAIPVVFLTVLSEQIYEEAALAGGAVDFVEKSRSFTIVLHRIRLVLQGAKAADMADCGPEPETLIQGDLTLNLRSKRAFWHGTSVDLTLSEFHILERLLTAAGEDVSYRKLYDVVHGPNFSAGIGQSGYRSNVRALIKRLRHKFRAIDDEFDMITNYPGFGYRWGR